MQGISILLSGQIRIKRVQLQIKKFMAKVG